MIIKEIPLLVPNLESINREVTTSIALLSYNKPKPRTLVVPGNFDDLPEEIEGGLYKTTQTHEGTLYYSRNDAPGYQVESGIYQHKDTQNLFTLAHNTIKNLHAEVTGEKNLPSYQNGWFYISPPSNNSTTFHEHTRFNDTFPHDPTIYTWTYYVQLPDNCFGDEGKLAYLVGKDEHVLDVQLNTLYVFPGSLPHRPNLAPNSNTNRITAAGNILMPGANKSLFTE